MSTVSVTLFQYAYIDKKHNAAGSCFHQSGYPNIPEGVVAGFSCFRIRPCKSSFGKHTEPQYLLYHRRADTYILLMETRPPTPNQDAIIQCVRSRVGPDAPRVEQVEVDGKKYWIKRPEKLNWRFRLQKGSPKIAFERERAAFHDMNGYEVPVPQLCAEGKDFLVLPDCGPDLRTLFRNEKVEERRHALLMEAARTLGVFHKKGFSHGRPSPKDMCRSDSGVLMLDFERYRQKNNTLKGQARDLVIFAFNVIAHSPNVRGSLSEAMEVYRGAAPDGTWQLSSQWCRRMRWAKYLVKPAQWSEGNRSKEFKAIPQLFDLFAGKA